MKVCQRHIFSLFISLLFVSSSFAQDARIDSIKQICLNTTDTLKLIDNYNKISGYFNYSNVDSSLHYAQTALKLSSTVNYHRGEGIARFRIGYCYDQTGQWDEAIENLEKAITIFENPIDTMYLIASYINLGILHSYQEEQIKGLEYLIKAKNLSETTADLFALPEIYTNIATYYEYLHEYRSAWRYHTKALEVEEKDNQIDNICISNIALGYVNIKLQRFDEALANLNRARELLPQLEDLHRETEVLVIFTFYYLEINNLAEAARTIEKTEKLINEQNFERLKSDLAYQKGKLRLKEKKYSEAITYFDTAIKLSNALNRYDILQDIYADKTEAYAKLGEYKKAYEVQQLSDKTDDLMQPHRIAQVLGEFEYQEALKEKQAQERLQQELLEEKNRSDKFRSRVQLQITAFSSILLIIVVIILGYYTWIRRKHNAVLKDNYETINRQNKLLEANLKQLEEDEQKLKQLNATKDKFFSIIAHDLKNPFNVLIGISDLLRTNSDIKDSKEFEALVEGMFQTATSGYNLLQNLLEWSRAQTGNLQFDPQPFYINKVFSANEILFKEAAKSKNLIINWPTNRAMVVADYNMVNFIFRNLLNNAIKFSYEGNSIDISIVPNETLLTCTIRDNGMGMDQDTLNKLFKIEHSVQKEGTANEKGTGLGLIICKEFVEKNGGSLVVESEAGKGSSFRFTLPLKK